MIMVERFCVLIALLHCTDVELNSGLSWFICERSDSSVLAALMSVNFLRRIND